MDPPPRTRRRCSQRRGRYALKEIKFKFKKETGVREAPPLSKIGPEGDVAEFPATEHFPRARMQRNRVKEIVYQYKKKKAKQKEAGVREAPPPTVVRVAPPPERRKM